MIKIIEKTEKEFKDILKKFEKIGKNFDYDDIPYHRYVEYIIDLIERNENNKIPILHPSSKYLLIKQISGFENIYIFNNKKENNNILRLSIIEIKSFEPENKKIKKYKDFHQQNNVYFLEKKRSKLSEAMKDILNHNKNPNRYSESTNILNKLLSLPNKINNSLDEYEINNIFFDDIKEQLNLDKIGTLDHLYKDLQKLWDNQTLPLVSIGTLISKNENIEKKWIENFKLKLSNEFKSIEQLTCIIQKVDSPDYKNLIDEIVEFNKQENYEKK